MLQHPEITEICFDQLQLLAMLLNVNWKTWLPACASISAAGQGVLY